MVKPLDMWVGFEGRGLRGEYEQSEEYTLYDDDDERIPENESDIDLRQDFTV